MDSVVVEVIDSGGSRTARRTVSVFPCAIGRAATCEIVIDSPDVSAVHARLIRGEDGGVFLEDAGSTNGLEVDGAVVARVAVEHRTEVRLGSVRLRFVAADAPLERTVFFRPSTLDRWGTLAAAIGAFLVVTGLEQSVFATERVKWWSVAVDAGARLLMAGAWAFAWALANRVAQGRFLFRGHWTVATVAGTVLALATSFALPVVRFALSLSERWNELLTFTTFGLVGVWLVAQHLRRVTLWGRARRVGSAGALVGALVAFGLVVSGSESEEYSAQLPVGGVAFPPALLPGVGVSPAQALTSLDRLREGVDAERARLQSEAKRRAE